jgi:hypothetical protein
MKVASLVGSLLLAGIVPARGADFSSVDLKPLLQQRESSCLKYNGLYLPPAVGCSDMTRLITKGGGAIETRASGPPRETRGWTADGYFLRGVGSAASLAELKQTLAQNRVGVQRDCSYPNFDHDRIYVTTGTDEIIWYGAQGRRNSFVITYFQPDQPPPTPLCPPEVEALLSALRGYIYDVGQEPDTERLSSR